MSDCTELFGPTPAAERCTIERAPRPRTRGQKIRRIGGRALMALVFVGTAGAGFMYDRVIGDIAFHKDTAQEKYLEAVFDKAYSTNDIQVRCKTPDYITALPYVPFADKPYAVGKGYPYTNTVWLSHDVCNSLTEIGSRPHKAADFELFTTSSEYPNRDDVVFARLEALHIVAHELGHAHRNTDNERVAECDAFQDVANIAVALGVARSLAPVLRNQVIELEQYEHDGGDKHAIQYSFDLGTCRDGGPLDLDPAHVGVFPMKP